MWASTPPPLLCFVCFYVRLFISWWNGKNKERAKNMGHEVTKLGFVNYFDPHIE